MWHIDEQIAGLRVERGTQPIKGLMIDSCGTAGVDGVGGIVGQTSPGRQRCDGHNSTAPRDGGRMVNNHLKPLWLTCTKLGNTRLRSYLRSKLYAKKSRVGYEKGM